MNGTHLYLHVLTQLPYTTLFRARSRGASASSRTATTSSSSSTASPASPAPTTSRRPPRVGSCRVASTPGRSTRPRSSSAPPATSRRAAASPSSPPLSSRPGAAWTRSEEHTSELQSLMRISYDVFCLKKKKKHNYQREQL